MLGFNCYFITEQLKVLSDKYPNDFLLGEKVRVLFGNCESIKNIPNNFSLGKIIRIYVNKI